MKTGVKVSVIIPAFNCAPFLPAALDSVFAQTFRDFEIIVVNDGSTDNTEEVIDPYRKAIGYLSGPNRGASAARNAALRISKGELIAFLDADDVWHPEKLREQVGLLDAQAEIGVCYTNFTFFGAPFPYRTGFEEREGALLRYPRRAIGPCQYAITSRSLLEDFLVHQAFPKPSMMMIRQRCFERVGYFDETLSICEDTQMCLRLAKHFGYGYVDQCLVQRRVRTDTLSSSANDRRYAAVHVQMFEDLGCWIPLSSGERRALDRALAGYRFAVGYLDLAEYCLASSRQHLWRSLRASFSLKTLFYLSLTFAPREIIKALRFVKQQIVRAVSAPALRDGAQL